MEKAADAVKAAAAIAQAVADGELTPSELSDFVTNYAKTLEISDLEARLQRLEAANVMRCSAIDSLRASRTVSGKKALRTRMERTGSDSPNSARALDSAFRPPVS